MGYKETEALSLEKYLESCGKLKKKIDPNGLSMKMLKECLAATKDLTTFPFSLQWTNWGTMSNGRFSTQKISESPKQESGSLLADILEEKVEDKYFLSKEQIRRIVLL